MCIMRIMQTKVNCSISIEDKEFLQKHKIKPSKLLQEKIKEQRKYYREYNE